MSTKTAAVRQRRIQTQTSQAKEKRPEREPKKPMQAGARQYPAPPFPKQHQPKPGSEARLDPAPLYDAPFYKGSGKLENMVALITGGDSGIGRSVAVLFAREGADVAISYLAEEQEDANLTKQRVEAEGRKCLLILADVSDQKACQEAVSRTVKEFGRSGRPGQQRCFPSPYGPIRGSDGRAL